MPVVRSCTAILACLVLAACGAEVGEGSRDGAGGTQEQLDEAVAKVTRMFEVLETAYPEGDDSPDAVVDAFSDAMVDEGLVERVRVVEEWQLGDPLPCGKEEEPSLGLIATDGKDSFFIGDASEAFVAGFAEDGGGDLGVVVARCVDGETGELRVAELPEDDAPLRVAIESFAGADEPAARAADKLAEAYAKQEPLDVEDRQQGWRLGEPIRCPESEEDPVAVGSGDGVDAFTGFGTIDVVVVRVQHAGEDIGAWAGSCDDGVARELRQLARPIDEARSDED